MTTPTSPHPKPHPSFPHLDFRSSREAESDIVELDSRIKVIRNSSSIRQSINLRLLEGGARGKGCGSDSKKKKFPPQNYA